MAGFKSVVKIKKDGVEYVSNVDACQYFLFELSRAALRDVGKLITTRFRSKYYQTFGRHTGNAGRVTKYKVNASKKTKYPRVEIGLKTGRNKGFYGYFQELGTSKTPKLGLLEIVAHENVAEIIKIQSQYLSGLESEAAALAMIDSEEDYDGGEEN